LPLKKNNEKSNADDNRKRVELNRQLELRRELERKKKALERIKEE
jgi:hypothetical protein